MSGKNEARVFREAVADVQPIRRPRRVPRPDAPPAPLPRQRQLDERAALRESLEAPVSIEVALGSGEELVFLRDGVAHQVLRRLRRGHWVVQASLDLHGLNRAGAAARVGEFLRACVAGGLRCVRIVHGKGLGSKNREPVLKQLMMKLLPRRDEVLAFCQAPAAEGGGGALLVLLKTRR